MFHKDRFCLPLFQPHRWFNFSLWKQFSCLEKHEPFDQKYWLTTFFPIIPSSAFLLDAFLPFGSVYCKTERRQWQPTPVLLPGKSHGRRSLGGCIPWGHEELDTNGQLHFHSPLSWTGEVNGNPLQCSCLENPGDRGAWWAAVYGVTESQTRLKRLSSSNCKTVFSHVLCFCA